MIGCIHTVSTAHGKTQGVVKFLLFIKASITFDEVFRWCNVIQHKSRAYGYVKGYYVTFQKIEDDNRLICQFNGLDWSFLVNHLEFEDIHNSWLYCFTNPLELGTRVSLSLSLNLCCLYFNKITITPPIKRSVEPNSAQNT